MFRISIFPEFKKPLTRCTFPNIQLKRKGKSKLIENCKNIPECTCTTIEFRQIL